MRGRARTPPRGAEARYDEAGRRRGRPMQGETMKRVAILDDYQGVATTLADWSRVAKDVSVEQIREHVADPSALARRLQGCEIAVIMRERTPFPRALFEKLPDLKLLVTSGMRNAAIDLAAAKERGVIVAGTASL